MRYLGGKNRQGQRILEAIVERGVGTSTWVEPFMGGANMSVKAAKVFDALVLSDIDTGLVEMFRAGVNGWVPRVRYPSKSEYDELKVSDQADPFAAFCSFAASYRGKKWGGVWGHRIWEGLLCGIASGFHKGYSHSKRG